MRKTGLFNKKTTTIKQLIAFYNIVWLLMTSFIWKWVVIIIIMLCRQHGYPWPSLATFPYRSSPLAGLLGYILCPHIAAVCKFGLVVLLLLGHMWGSIGVRHFLHEYKESGDENCSDFSVYAFMGVGHSVGFRIWWLYLLDSPLKVGTWVWF